MILLALIGCPKHVPAPLWTEPVPRVEVAPVVIEERDKRDCAVWTVIEPGETAPCGGVVLPWDGPDGARTYTHHQRRDHALTPAYESCVVHRGFDRAAAEDRYGTCQYERHALEQDVRQLRPVVPIAFGLGVVLGGGAVYGMARALLGAGPQ